MSATALLVIDMLNPYEHEDAETLARSVSKIVEPLASLVELARENELDVVYVNDNYEDYAATRDDLVRRALEGRHPELIEPIVPAEGSDFLQKVRHSAFYGTVLDHLLRRREISKLVLAGQVTEQCILYTALDAYVRHYEIRLPHDAVADIEPALGTAALQMMERNMRAEVVDAASCLNDVV